MADKRWKLLRDAILNRGNASSTDATSRTFHPGYDLFVSRTIKENEKEFLEYDLELSGGLEKKTLKFQLVDPPKLDVNQVDSPYFGFLNTGRILWISEQVLSFWALENAAVFRGQRVLEIGAGSIGLCGFAIGSLCDPRSVVLTDGNKILTDNIARNIEMNEQLGQIPTRLISASPLLWGDSILQRIPQFDVILGSDCFFDTSLHAALLTSIQNHLSSSGQAIFAAPQRGDSFDKFAQAAQLCGFQTEVMEKYSERVWQAHLKNLDTYDRGMYDADVHYPLLLRLSRREEETHTSEY